MIRGDMFQRDMLAHSISGSREVLKGALHDSKKYGIEDCCYSVTAEPLAVGSSTALLIEDAQCACAVLEIQVFVVMFFRGLIPGLIRIHCGTRRSISESLLRYAAAVYTLW